MLVPAAHTEVTCVRQADQGCSALAGLQAHCCASLTTSLTSPLVTSRSSCAHAPDRQRECALRQELKAKQEKGERGALLGDLLHWDACIGLATQRLWEHLQAEASQHKSLSKEKGGSDRTNCCFGLSLRRKVSLSVMTQLATSGFQRWGSSSSGTADMPVQSGLLSPCWAVFGARPKCRVACAQCRLSSVETVRHARLGGCAPGTP